ncbi:SCO2521 family protein [Nocardia sp. NPDC057353]|uniref:SCO2521 family protein n=1 Tax=Nocardia sp. NPDC057353 TaxID=3346104 RepID=UPI00362C36A8
MDAPLLMLGEIHTCAVPNSTALVRTAAEELLTVMPGRLVEWRERPNSLAVSPIMAEGFDCRLPTPSGAAMRAIGTAAVTGQIAGGRILQSSAWTRIRRARAPKREPWSYYLAAVGTGEVITQVTPRTGTDLIEGFLQARTPSRDALDLASISRRLLAELGMGLALDQRAPLHSGTTRLRWAARIGETGPAPLMFRLEDDRVRTVLITVGDEAELAQVGRFCADLARHDWLLGVAAAVMDEADSVPATDLDSAEAIIGPLLAGFIHLWAPGAHTPALVRGLWQDIERDPGFSAEWSARLGHLHGRMSVATLAAFRRPRVGSTD